MNGSEEILPGLSPTLVLLVAKGGFGVGFSDATRGRLSDADRCLASEKRSSGKSRGWSWCISGVYGDLWGSGALDPTGQAGCMGHFRENAT